jgi:hypothetical protein
MGEEKRFLTRTEPEVAWAIWGHREYQTTKPIKDDSYLHCDLCNSTLDWEPYLIIDFPGEEQQYDPEYDPIGSQALCQSCAKKEYNITIDDVGKVFRIWFCYNLVEY